MKRFLSVSASAVSWLATVLTALATLLWFKLFNNGDGWAAVGFYMMAMPVAGCALLLGFIPSAALYYQGRQRVDLQSLWMSGGACLVLLAEVTVLSSQPRSGC